MVRVLYWRRLIVTILTLFASPILAPDHGGRKDETFVFEGFVMTESKSGFYFRIMSKATFTQN